MSKIIVVVAMQIALSIVLLPGQVMATDGDVDYSSPYITVDPETGQLVTKNPGPRLKTHPQDSSSMAQMGEQTVDSSPVAGQPVIDGPGNLSMPENQQMGATSIITIITGAVMVFGALAFWKFRQRQ